MTMMPFRGRCHTCGHDHDAEDVRLRDLMSICDQAAPLKATEAERCRWEQALAQTWQMIDPLSPPGVPGSYARGQYQGIVDALTTLRANLKTPNDVAERETTA